MIFVWIAIAVVMVAMVVIEIATLGPKHPPCDLEETFKDGWN